jgi:hypothetical protein
MATTAAVFYAVVEQRNRIEYQRHLTESGDDSSQNQEQNDNQQKHAAANIHFELLLETHSLRRECGKRI